MLAISSANLAANLENLQINREILARSARADAARISLLTEIRDLLRGETYAGK